MYDVLIKGGTVIDGTGSPGFISDVAISGGKIASIARRIEEGAKTVIDAGGLCVTPGFIDTHSHSDLMLLDNPHLEEKVRQGVTTEVLGQDGLGLAPLASPEAKEMLQEHLAGLLGTPDIEWDWSSFAEYLKRYSRKGIINNVGVLASHGAVRIAVMGMEDRHASQDELNKMKEILDECMRSGALGLSTGLIYPPCCYAAFDELVELCKVVAEHSGALVVHVRNEADSIMDAHREMLNVSRASGVHLHISHLKTIGKNNWGRAKEILDNLENHKKEGLAITADQYPYIAGSTALSACLPPWVHAGGSHEMLSRLSDPEERKKIRESFDHPTPSWEDRGKREGWENVIVSSVGSNNPAIVGKSIVAIAAERGCDPIAAVMDIVLEEKNKATMVVFQNCEESLKEVMKRPWVMVGTDGIYGSGKPHPRLFGTFPRILGKYVREEKVLFLEEAIRKMTGLPAAAFRLTDRGVLKEGLAADVAVFDPLRITDRATFEEPRQYPDGISHVLVNGIPVISDGKPTGNLPGQVLAAK